MRRAYLKIYLKEVSTTFNNILVSTQRGESTGNTNLLFNKRLKLRHNTNITPSGLCMMGLNSNIYKLFEEFLLLMYEQLDSDFFLYKALLFSNFT